MNLIHDAVKACHQECSKAQIGIGRRVREANFDTASLIVHHVRDANGCRAVTSRVSQLHRCFKVRNQTLIRVRRRVRDGIQSTSVLDDAADVVKRFFAQTGITVADKEVLAVLPNGLVAVHAAAGATHNRLRHKGDRLTVGGSHIPNRVLLDLGPVGAFDQRVETRTDFALTGTVFMVLDFNGNALLFKQQAHFRAHVLERVDRRYREVTTLVTRTVTEVALFVFDLGRPTGFIGADLEEGVFGVVIPSDGVENVEFGFRAKVSRVTDAGGLQISFGALGNRARVTFVTFTRSRVRGVAREDQRIFFAERIDVSRVRIGNQNHVTGFDTGPTLHRGTVKRLTVFEEIFIDKASRNGKVLFLALHIREAEVNELDVVVFNEL